MMQVFGFLPAGRRQFYEALGVLLGLCLSGLVAAESVRIAAAADLRPAMLEIVTAFEDANPAAQVDVIYGSSGRFRTQIENGAPFDLYFSADIAYPQALQQAGLVAGEVMPYATGRIVLWSNTVDAATLTVSDLANAEFRRIAIANPRHAPYGARAEEALRASGVWEAVQERLVFGENIGQTLQMVQSGAADVGIVALSLVRSPAMAGQGDHHLIDESLHAPLNQGFVVTRRAADNATAIAFADYMAEPEVQAILRQYGFGLPEQQD